MAAITIGTTPVNRGTSFGVVTLIELSNPAGDSGTINTVEIWASSNLSNCEVATFFNVSGNNYSTRDSAALGAVTAGSKQTFSGLSITCQTGDYIGIYYTAGSIERDTSGGSGVMWAAGDQIPCTNKAFSASASNIISLYASGTTGGWTNIAKVGGVTATDLAKLDGIAVGSIAKVCGVAV